jgi:hypothetical protein
MLKQITYTYVGTNGILTTPIHLEGIPSLKKIILTAEGEKMLTKDNKNFVKKVALTSEEEITLWQEVTGQK